MNFKKISCHIVPISTLFFITIFDFTAGRREDEYTYRSKRLAPEKQTISTGCPSDKFQCGNGKCLDANKVCNNYNDCDVDEDAQYCLTFFQKQQQSNENCLLPSASAHQTFLINCPKNANCSQEAGKQVPISTQIIVSCNTGYKFKDGRFIISICVNGIWRPTIPECYRTCEPIRNPDMDLTCHQDFRGVSIPCDEVMPQGAIVYPKCKDFYHPDRAADYSFIQCLPNGQWDRQLFKCIADCGRAPGNTQSLIVGGKPERRGDSPWHVAIYDISAPNDPLLICGGTIIAPQIIVSAAHCFYNDARRTFYSSSQYKVVVAKYTLDYKVNDNKETKAYKIRKIITPEELIPFKGEPNHYIGDIALLWTSERIEFSSGVLPACVEWTPFSRFSPPPGIEGKLVGWGLTENGTASSILLATFLPYVSNKNCTEMVSKDFTVGSDKFCAGTIKGVGARPGDSGSGLLFRKIYTHGNLYYLRGVMSNKDGTIGEKQTSLAAFTDIAQFTTWMYKKRIEIENEESQAENKDILRNSFLGSCDLPPASHDKNFTVRCLDGGNCNQQPGSKVPKNTEVLFKCISGYKYNNKDSFVSTCSNGTWIPPIAECSKQ